MQSEVFDIYAKTYDEHFTNSLIGMAQREQVYQHVSRRFSDNIKNVLEVNCGTGQDALWFSEKGVTVLATDVSEGMIEIAKRKVNNNKVEFKKIASQQIDVLFPDMFNLIFSNFGGLNCLNHNELIDFKKGCSKLQQKDDLLIFVIMGTQCWWEQLYFKFKKDKIKANRRINKLGVETVINDKKFLTYYYTPNYFKELFFDGYDFLQVKPIGLFVPPSYLEPYFVNREITFNFLIWLDKLFGKFSFLSNYADHYIIVFKKK